VNACLLLTVQLAGLVQTEEFDSNLVPGYIKIFMWVGMKLIGTTPDQYANFPVYVSPLLSSCLSHLQCID
jgi:hypothetical protein